MIQQNTEQLHFGTSGVRALVVDLTDQECYIWTRGFVRYLSRIREIKTGDKIALGGDLRKSTPRIMKAIHKAITDEGYQTLYCGFVPTPAISYFAWKRNTTAVMVTGSHIPEDRNGIKFTKSRGEVLKSDEKEIYREVEKVRNELSSGKKLEELFDQEGLFKTEVSLPPVSEERKVLSEFKDRYTQIFPSDIFKRKKIVLYEHSAVGRDVLKDILKTLGAEVVPVGRSEKFIPIDNEKLSESTLALFRMWAEKYQPFAIVSTDGDSDRPILVDEKGFVVPSNIVGVLISIYLKPDFVAVTIACNDAIKTVMKNAEIVLTKVGSPPVIAAMNEKLAKDSGAKVVSYEQNGGYLLGSDFPINGKKIEALPTRDSILPIIISLAFAKDEGLTLSALLDRKIPHRFANIESLDNKVKGCETYTASLGKKIVESFSPEKPDVKDVYFTSEGLKISGESSSATKSIDEKMLNIKKILESYFSPARGYASITAINYIDGVRISFSNNDVVHIRPSNNAPDLRFYVTADSQKRVAEILADRFTIIPAIISDILKNQKDNK